MTSVYFIEAEGICAIKIGIASDVQRRLMSLQTANSSRLVLLLAVPGDRAVESALHSRFRDARISGEWFAAAAVRPFIAAIEALSPDARAELLGRRFPRTIVETDEEIAQSVERSERLLGACTAVIREFGIDRAAAELSKRWGSKGRRVSPATIAGVLDGRYSLRAEWLHWFAGRSAEVADILNGVG